MGSFHLFPFKAGKLIREIWCDWKTCLIQQKIKKKKSCLSLHSNEHLKTWEVVGIRDKMLGKVAPTLHVQSDALMCPPSLLLPPSHINESINLF